MAAEVILLGALAAFVVPRLASFSNYLSVHVLNSPLSPLRKGAKSIQFNQWYGKKVGKTFGTSIRHAIALLLCMQLGEIPSPGYPVRSQFSLLELATKADVVFKGTVTSSIHGNDPSAGDQKTVFKIVSVIKGPQLEHTVTFLHLDHLTQPYMDIDPVHYHFDVGKTYLVFAKDTNTPGVYAALWNMPQSEGNQGVFLCADDKTVSATLKDEVWAELTGLLQHHDNTDILYAIQQLDRMSGMGWGTGPPTRFDSTLEFARKPVVDAVHGFVASSDPKVAEAAIVMIGSNNPYLTQERAWFWLATVGSGEISGLSKMNPKMENIGGELYWSDLVAVADSSAPETTRALAIRALGLARKPEIGAQLDKWLTDTSPPVRSAATVVLADYPELSNPQRLNRTYVDPNADVRIATAQCIGFGQVKDAVKFLSSMLNDSNLEVRKAAAQSLLSFSPRDPDVATILKANLGNHEFAEVFTISLARIDPEPYRDELARSLATWSPTNPPPAWWWGGRLPCGDAQEILFKYLKAQSAEKLKAGGFDRYLDVIEKASFNNLGSPLDVYAFYIRHGLTTRAQALRQAALKAFPYQQAIQYDQAAEHPEIYDQ